MSILIKGMEMPKNCYVCPLCDYVSARCDAVIGTPYTPTNRYDTRAEWCPLFPVPDHGRLIDADALWVEINKICDRRDAGIITDLTCLQQILSAVRHSPTIIEAEEAKEWEAIEEYEDEYWDDGCPIED